MVANSGTTQDEKTLAGLGITFGDHYMYDVSAARTRNVVLQTIIGGIGGAMGSVIAKVTYDAGVAVKTAEEQRFIQKDGLQAIKENPKSSQDEKTIAELGIVFGDSYMNNTSATKARNVVLQTIIGNISGPIGSAIAKVTYDAGVKVETAKEQRAIQKQGLQGIVANSGATKEEKALAELGIEFGDSYMYDTSATKARNVVLNTIKGGINGSIGSVIAKVTYDAGVAVKTAEEQRAIQRQGFEAILANPDTTEEQKLLAQRGIDVGDHYMYDTSAAKARNIILQELFK